MNKRLLVIFIALSPLVLSTNLAMADDAVQLDTAALPSKVVYDTAEVTPLAVSSAGEPKVVLLRVASGQVVPPHRTESGLRLITVVEGDMSWGNGETVDETAEVIYPAGSFLMLPEGSPHWLAARSGNVLLQLVTLDDETPTPAVVE